MKSSDPIDLSTISMQYWLEGPETVLPYSQLNPDTYFLARCDWATTGEASPLPGSCAVICASQGAAVCLVQRDVTVVAEAELDAL